MGERGATAGTLAGWVELVGLGQGAGQPREEGGGALFTLTAIFECLMVDSRLGLSVLVLILLGLSVLITSWRTNITEPVRTDTSSLGLFMSCHHMS